MNKITLLFLLLFSALGFSQRVVIVDGETGEPIPDVTVFDQDRKKMRISGADGEVDLSGFDDNDRLFFRHIGHISKKIRKKDITGDRVVLSPSSEELDEVVVSVSKWEQQKRDIPQKVVSVRAADISLANPQTSADLLEGQVYIQKSQSGGGSPMIRGFATNRVLLSVDGIRMNNAIFRGGNIQNVISIDPFTVDRAEVVFGPGSVIYGSDAIGGVMNFYTREAKMSHGEEGGKRVSGAAVLRHATANNEKTGHIEVNYGADQWASFTSFSYNRFGDLRMGKHGPDDYLRQEYVKTMEGGDIAVKNNRPGRQVPTGYKQYNLLQKFRYAPGENWDFALGLYYTGTTDNPRYDRLLEYRDGQPRSAVWYYGPQKWFMGNLRGSKKQSNTGWYDQMKFALAYQYFGESRFNRDFGKENLYASSEKVDAYSASIDFEKQFVRPVTLFYGLEYVYNKVHSSAFAENIRTAIRTDSPSRYPDGSSWQSVAAYVNAEYKINPRMTLLSGLRYSHILMRADFDRNFYDFSFEKARLNTGALTGSMGMSWLPGETWQLTLNATTAFRSPNIDDMGKVFDSEPGAVVVPNPGLKPEYAYTVEAGLRKNFKNRVSLNAAVYYTLLDNALVRRDFRFNGLTEIEYQGKPSRVQAIQNAAQAYVYGLELGVDISLTDHISLLSNLSVTEGREELDNGEKAPLRHAAPLFGNSRLVWKKDRWKVDLFAMYNGKIAYEDLAPSEKNKGFMYAKDRNGNPYTPSWHTLNLRAAYGISGTMELTAALENITDRRYRPYASGIAAAGRNFVVGARYLF